MHFRLYAYVIAAMITVTANASEQPNSGNIISHRTSPRRKKEPYSIYCMTTPGFTWSVLCNYKKRIFTGFYYEGKAICTFDKEDQKKSAEERVLAKASRLAEEYELLKKCYKMEQSPNPNVKKVIRQAALEPNREEFRAFIQRNMPEDSNKRMKQSYR